MTVALLLGAAVAFNLAVFLAWGAYCEITRARERRRNAARAEHNRLVDASWAAVRARMAGAHEQCEVPEREDLWFDYIASRYRGLGQDVTVNKESQS